MTTVTVEMVGDEAILAKLQKLADAHGSVKAGVLENEKSGSGEVMDYAPIQEFGGSISVTDKMRGFLAVNYGIHLKKSTGVITIPPRSFLRSTFKEKKDAWMEELARRLKGGVNAETALDHVGTKMSDDIKDKILSNVPPPNSAATDMIKVKSGWPASVGRTLYHTGKLHASIDFEVES